MSDVAIRVENLGKKYILRHQQEGRSYKALRDVLALKAKSLFRAGRNGASSPNGTREEFWALQDVSFEIKRGETVGIIGRNGAGKSTLLKILSRITEQSVGRIEIEGKVASLLEVGTGFHPELTGRENIYLNGAILGMRRADIKRQFDEIVAFAEVERFLDTPVKRYSSGMYMRLAFAVAAHLEPEVLVVDEVLAVGDSEFQKKCLGKMSEVSRAGRTVLFVSHNMSAIRNLCPRAIILEKGKVKLDGAADLAIDTYSTNNCLNASANWIRPGSEALPPIFFKEIQVTLIGQQPDLTLQCEILLECRSHFPASFLAVDICDLLSVSIMQALPEVKPFVSFAPGLHRVNIQIDLPPLIPGMYTTDFWIGSHFADTIDHVRAVATFEVTESPSPGRTFPHYKECGFLVPPSRHVYTPPTALDSLK